MRALLVPLGLGVFIIGVRVMGRSLGRLAGGRIRSFLVRATSTPIRSVLAGALLTSFLQSSSATSAIVVGLVHGRVIALPAAVGIIMGSNVGTTVTAQFMALGLDSLGLAFLAGGLALLVLRRRDWRAGILTGLGLLLLGLGIMKGTAAYLQDLELFQSLVIWLREHPLQGFLAGFLLTVSLQSSSASIGLLQTLAGQGIMTVPSLIPMIYGENVGTTTTALIASLGLSRDARRAAVSHLVFNLLGSLLFIGMAPIVAEVVGWMSSSPARQLAHAHTLFNAGSLMIQLPLLGALVAVSGKLVPPEARPLSYSAAPRSLRRETSLKGRQDLVGMIRLVRHMIAGVFQGHLKDEPLAVTKVALRKESLDRMWRRSYQLSDPVCAEDRCIQMSDLLQEAGDICLGLARGRSLHLPRRYIHWFAEACLGSLEVAAWRLKRNSGSCFQMEGQPEGRYPAIAPERTGQGLNRLLDVCRQIRELSAGVAG